MWKSVTKIQDKDTWKKVSIVESKDVPWKYGIVLLNPDGSKITGWGGGGGDVKWPSSSVNWNVAIFCGADWKCIVDSGKTIPSCACDVGALPDSTRYGASLDISMDVCTYVLEMQLKDQCGCNLWGPRCVDLPLESVVVCGCYDCACKEVELDLQWWSCIRFGIWDLVCGLQSEINSCNKLCADYVDDSCSINKFVSSSDICNWNGKADMCDIPTDNCQLSNGCGYTSCTGTVSSCNDIINRLWYTPYNSINPNGYTSCTGTLQSCDIACINWCCLTGGGDICIQWWQDYSWVTKTISWWNVELWLRTIVNVPTSDFTLVKPADLIDWEEYAIRVISETSYCMCLWSCFTNPRNVDTCLSRNATDQYVFLSIWWELELQPLVDTWA